MHGPCSDKKQTCTNDHMSEYMSYAAMLITLSEKPISMHLVDCSSLSQASAHLEMCQQSSSDGRARHPQTSSQSLLQNRSRYIKTAGAQNSQESSNLKTK